MANRRIDPRRIKIHRSYTVKDAADALGAHKNTIAQWIKQGLAVADQSRPVLLLGTAIRAFLENRKARRKRRLAAGEFYCLKCREPKSPYGGVADYIASSSGLGSLVGLCPVCETLMNRRTSFRKLDVAKGRLEVTILTPSAAPKREN
jgi:hypothetical protein